MMEEVNDLRDAGEGGYFMLCRALKREMVRDGMAWQDWEHRHGKA